MACIFFRRGCNASMFVWTLALWHVHRLQGWAGSMGKKNVRAKGLGDFLPLPLAELLHGAWQHPGRTYRPDADAKVASDPGLDPIKVVAKLIDDFAQIIVALRSNAVELDVVHQCQDRFHVLVRQPFLGLCFCQVQQYPPGLRVASAGQERHAEET